MGGSRRPGAAAMLAATIILSWAGGAAAVDKAIVAKTGDMAPGAGGATFSDFFLPAVNGAGGVAVFGFLNDSREGIWVSGPVGLTAVAKVGDLAPGAGGASFSVLLAPVPNGAGEIAFQASLSDSSEGIWVGRPAGLVPVAKSGDAAPGTSGETFTSAFNPVLNGAGAVAFEGNLSGGGRGIWVGDPAGVALVAKEGDPAPDTGGKTFSGFFGDPVLNGAGEVAFYGFLGRRGGIWVGRPAALSLVAKEGDRAPGTGGAVFRTLGNPVLNAAGEVAVLGRLSDGSRGIWVGGPAALAPVVKTGDPAPGAPGPTFSDLGEPVLNGAGEVAFWGGLSDGRQGIWKYGAARLALVAKTGDVAPGTGGTTFRLFEDPAVNGSGELAFWGVLSDGRQGIWAGRPGGLQIIARGGDAIEVMPGHVAIVAELDLSTETGNEDGRRSGFSEAGQVAFRARFTDGSQGLLLSPPEPPTVHRIPYRAIAGGWSPVMLPRSFAEPVIIAGPPGFENKQPGVVRLRGIKGAEGRFQARFQEWRYLDGRHPAERTDFLVMERGRKRQDDGSIWEAGTVDVEGNRVWKRTRFTKRFRRPPQVFATVQSYEGATAVAARVRNVTRSGFEISIQEEEKDLAGGHPPETVGYLAVDSRRGRGTIAGGVDGARYRLKQPKVGDHSKKVLGARIKLEEEKSKDKETKHKKESVSVMTLGRGLFAQQASDKEPDTAAIRRR